MKKRIIFGACVCAAMALGLFFALRYESLTSSTVVHMSITSGEQEKIITDLAKKNPTDAWEYLKKAFTENNQVIGNAHWLSHIIGNELYAHYGLKGIALCDDTFAFGCYHGVSEEMLRELGPSAARGAEQECKEIFSGEELYEDLGMCIHGFGHGLLSWHGLDITRALNDCDLLNDKYRVFCYDGVFMEYSFGTHQHTLSLNNPWDFCGSFAVPYQNTCARYQALLFLKALPSDFNRVAAECLKASRADFSEVCVITLGHAIAQNALGDLGRIEQSCAAIVQEEGKYLCAIGAAEETIFQEYRNWEEAWQALCAKLPDDWKQRCVLSNQEIIDRYQRLSPL